LIAVTAIDVPPPNAKDERIAIVKMNLTRIARVVAVVVGIGLGGGAIQAVGAPLFQDRSPDYSKNKTYQQGMREGKVDQAHNRDHSKKRTFKKDDDQKAYEAGYQKGRGN
jgi:hypothetical protein